MQVAAARTMPLRVDPRPLTADPRIVTLHDTRGLAEELFQSGFALADSTVVSARRGRILRRLGVPETDAISDRSCPGIFVPQTAVNERRLREHCPTRPYVSVVASLPRKGGAHWPGHVDERSTDDSTVYSLRVIQRSMNRDGSVETSADYVFRFEKGKDWVFVKRKRLLIVE